MAHIIKRLAWLVGNGITKTGRTIAVAFATQADQETATSTATSVSPGRQQYHPSAAKTWAEFDANGGIGASFNVTSITDNGTGNWTANVATDFSSASWAAFVSGGGAAAGAAGYFYTGLSIAAGTYAIVCWNSFTTVADPAAVPLIMFVGYGDQ